jgi:2,4-dienoyl-CoA reductase-like NADH-dependent reductase (Old Yellow Enzyme family)
MTDLFSSYDLRGLALPNRILLSAMTRTRATDDHVPTAVMRDYFVQCAAAGLLLTDCTAVSPHVRELDARGIGYLTMLEPNAKEKEKGVAIMNVSGTFRPMTTAAFITNTGYDKAKGNAVLGNGNADLVAYGVPYIANPDLVARFQQDAPLNKPNPALFYGVGAEGYTDYPAPAA